MKIRWKNAKYLSGPPARTGRPGGQSAARRRGGRLHRAAGRYARCPHLTATAPLWRVALLNIYVIHAAAPPATTEVIPKNFTS